MRVDIYLNIHKSKKLGKKVFSIKDKKINKVVDHSSGGFFIKNASFIVSKAGRERVIKEKRKNVHAFIRGQFVTGLKPSKEAIATYNPYLYDSFVDSVTKKKIFASDLVYIDLNGKIYYR
tara:strand:+ start:87 stop:446 length:360 start_codon:yes stop_codon:yes gene_type:complete